MLAYITNLIPTVINFSPADANVTKPVVEYCVRNKCIKVLQQYIDSIDPKYIIDIALDAKEFIFLTLVPDCKHYVSYLDHVDFCNNLSSILPLLRINDEFILWVFNSSCYFVDIDNIHYLCRTYKDILAKHDPLSHAYHYYTRVSNILVKYFTADMKHVRLWQELGLSIKYLLLYNPKLVVSYSLSYIKLWSH